MFETSESKGQANFPAHIMITNDLITASDIHITASQLHHLHTLPNSVQGTLQVYNMPSIESSALPIWEKNPPPPLG